MCPFTVGNPGSFLIFPVRSWGFLIQGLIEENINELQIRFSFNNTLKDANAMKDELNAITVDNVHWKVVPISEEEEGRFRQIQNEPLDS